MRNDANAFLQAHPDYTHEWRTTTVRQGPYYLNMQPQKKKASKRRRKKGKKKKKKKVFVTFIRVNIILAKVIPGRRGAKPKEDTKFANLIV